jgi:branched-chain amino acid aminotransferase
MQSLVAYSNGNWIPASELAVAVDDVGFLLGATVTERLRTFGGKVFRLEEHLRRLQRSLEIIGLGAEPLISDLAEAIPQFATRNHGQIAVDDDWSIAAFVTPGAAGAGRPTVCVHGWPLPFGQWARFYENGLATVISDIRQVPDNCWPSDLKCRSRMHYYLADMHAKARKPGSRAILLDQDGYVAESTTANLLVYREEEGLSSPPSDHILVGISLGVVQEVAGQLGIPFMRRRIARDELADCDEVMLTSTSVCVLPVVECDGNRVGTGKPGSTCEKLLAAWSEMVGVDVVGQALKYAARK